MSSTLVHVLIVANRRTRHIAHKGGSDPKEKNHITAKLTNKNGQFIKNSYNGGVGVSCYASNSENFDHRTITTYT